MDSNNGQQGQRRTSEQVGGRICENIPIYIDTLSGSKNSSSFNSSGGAMVGKISFALTACNINLICLKLQRGENTLDCDRRGIRQNLLNIMLISDFL